MATSSYDSDFSLKVEQFKVQAGATLAQWIGGNAVAGCNTIWVQHLSGGTLFILSDGSGSTMSAAALAGASSTGMLFVASATPFEIPGPANFYLAAGGATATVNVMYGKTQGA